MPEHCGKKKKFETNLFNSGSHKKSCATVCNFPSPNPFTEFHWGRHWHLLSKNIWESTAMFLRLLHFHPFKSHILVMTAMPQYSSEALVQSSEVQVCHWDLRCCLSDVEFANSFNGRAGFHQPAKPSKLRGNAERWVQTAWNWDVSYIWGKMSAHRTYHHSAQESISHQAWAIPSGLQFLSHWHFSCFWGGHMVFPWPCTAPELQSAVYWEQVVLTSHNVSCPYILSAINILSTSYASAAFLRILCQKRANSC